MTAGDIPLAAERFEVGDSPEEWMEFVAERGWSDGLPIIPPTLDRVTRMLAAIEGDPDTIVGAVPPSWSPATLEKIAINCVMAGCKPAYLPVVVTALEAMLERPFNLYGIQATTHPAAPLTLVSGPIGRELNINSGSGCFGPGWQANATIGRAIRLILLNIGSAKPGVSDMATHGSPAKFSYCIAENEERSPWEPLHVSRGFDVGDSCVTVFGGEAPHNVNDHVSSAGKPILLLIADMMSTLGSNPMWFMHTGEWLVLIGPEHAATIARDGFSLDDIRNYLWQHARNPVRRLMIGSMWGQHDFPMWLKADLDDLDARIPVCTGPDRILVTVAGGPGKHSVVIPNATINLAVTKRIDRIRSL